MENETVGIVASVKDLCAIKNGMKNLHCGPDGQIVGASELIKACESLISNAEKCIGEQIAEELYELELPTEVSTEIEEQIDVDDFKSLGRSSHMIDEANMRVNVNLCFEDTIAVEVKLDYYDDSEFGADPIHVLVDDSYGSVQEAADGLKERIENYIKDEGYDIEY